MLDAAKQKIGRSLSSGYWKCLEHGRVYLTDEGMRRHREVEHDDPITLFRCTACGKIYQDIGSLHGHAEKHTGFLSFANVDRLMDYTEKLEVTDYRTVPVEGSRLRSTSPPSSGHSPIPPSSTPPTGVSPAVRAI